MTRRRSSATRWSAIICTIGACVFWVLAVTSSAASQETSERATGDATVEGIAAEFGLTAQERVGLQQNINELIYYYRARQAVGRRLNSYLGSLERRLTTLRRSKAHLESWGLQSIHHRNQLDEALFKLRENYATSHVFDPKAADKGAHVPGWGWVLLRAIPAMKQEMYRQNTTRLSEWEGGRTSFPFNWPGHSWENAKGLDALIQRDQEEIRRMGENPARDAYSTPFPHLNWVTRTRINASIEAARARLLTQRDDLRAGRLVLAANDRPGQMRFLLASSFITDFDGWVTKAQVQERLTVLEGQKAAVWKQFNGKSLPIHTTHTKAWTTEAELEASMADIVKKSAAVGTTIVQGDYQTRVPGDEKAYTRNGLNEEMKKLQTQWQAIERDPQYSVPVFGFGALTREGIQNAWKRKNLTADQRASLSRAPLEAARKLEIDCLRMRHGHLQYINQELVDVGSWEGPVFSSIRGTAHPLLSHYRWDLAERKALISEFTAERNHKLLFLDLRINHLKQRLASH